MAKQSKATVLRVAVSRVGVRRGYRVATFVVCWAITEEALGRGITLDEYAEWWKENPRTAQREQALFRQAFPDERTPHRIVEMLRALRPDWRERGVAGLDSVDALSVGIVP